MNDAARAALKVIRDCVDAGRYVVSRHFTERMDQRGLVWPDVVAVIEEPSDVFDGGPEQFGRPKWIVAGDAADGLQVEIVCVLDDAGAGETTVFVTLYYS
jgi:hypothetical protein